jgi:hypothetical protein
LRGNPAACRKQLQLLPQATNPSRLLFVFDPFFKCFGGCSKSPTIYFVQIFDNTAAMMMVLASSIITNAANGAS